MDAAAATSLPEVETQAAFARRLGVHRCTITNAKKAGRLVMTAAGLVDVGASLAMLSATQGTLAAHEANRERLAAARGKELPETTPGAVLQGLDVRASLALLSATGTTPGAGLDGLSASLADIGHQTKLAAMQRLQALARKAQREDELDAGTVIRRDAVVADLTTAVSLILAAGETIPDRVAPLLLNQPEPGVIQDILRDEWDRFRRTISERLLAVVGEGAP